MREFRPQLGTNRIRLFWSLDAFRTYAPYDAEAARGAGAMPVGLLTGHFSRSDLLDGGCAAVFSELDSLADAIENFQAAQHEGKPRPDIRALI